MKGGKRIGAGRPKQMTPRRVSKTFTISPQANELLRLHRNKSAFVEKLIIEAHRHLSLPSLDL